MVTFNGVTVYFGGQTLFEEITFTIQSGDRVGLVGKNGSGKTTLLKMINGEDKPNEGTIQIVKNCRIGYLSQDIKYKDGKTVFDETVSSFKEVRSIEKEKEQLLNKLETLEDHKSDVYLEISDRIADLESQYALLGGYNIQTDISKVLIGLGFQKSDFNRPTHEFSGGWRMRIELAKLLLQQPNLLLLDEPTNHLDIESIMWLENWLKSYKGAILLVSHDRYFLNAVTNRTIEIAFKQIFDYKAPYSKYRKMRKERREKLMQARKNQDKFIKHTEELIEKFRYKKNKAAFAQTLIKKLERIERITIERDDVSSMYFKFPPAPHSGKVVFTGKQITKYYNELEVFSNVSLQINKGEKIAFVGKNGAGKTTLARIIADNLDFNGNMELGHLVEVGYYAQNQSNLLDEKKTVFSTVEDATTEATFSNVRNILGSFQFSGDSVEKKVKVLSGGERAKLALCKLLLEPINLLVMDEPTNHLDMASKDILKQALLNYNGALIIVSHDRGFLEGLTTKVYEFKDKTIKEYIGDVSAFLKSRNLSGFKQLEANKPVKKEKTDSVVSSNKQQYEKKKQLQRDIRKAANQSAKLEIEITKIEKEISKMEQVMADKEQLSQLDNQHAYFLHYEECRKQLGRMMKEWEGVQKRLEELE